MMARLFSKLLALLLTALLVGAAAVYPADKRLLAGLLLAVGAVLLYRPGLWLLLAPALLPLLDFAPWTGSIFLEDLDLLLLLCAAVGYWRLDTRPPLLALPPWQRGLLVLLMLCVAISTWIGLQPLPPLDANAFTNYNSPYNSLRTAKGYLWALVLLPLMRRSAARDPDWLMRYFVPGMLIGLAGTCLAVLWERNTFPGLLNFSADYRPTAPFSAMHTGGAALDAYLAISLPFVLFWLHDARSHADQHRARTRLVSGLLLLALGSFAGFALFSRDIYLAYGGALAVVALLSFGHRLRGDRINWRTVLGAAVVLTVISFALYRVFATGGYRGLAAALIVLAAALVLAGTPERPRLSAAVIGFTVLLCGIDLALTYGGVVKGAYLAFGLSATLSGLGAVLLFSAVPALRSRGMALAMAAAPSLGLSAVLVAVHWGGVRAAPDSVLLVAIAAGLVLLNRGGAGPLLRLDRQTTTAALFSGIVLAMLIPITSSYYFTERFATVGADAGVRLRHWNEAVLMMQPDLATTAFGMGLGAYPRTYFWKNLHGEIPGSYSYQDEQTEHGRYLRLGTARYEAGYGEVLRMLQHVPARTGGRYSLSFDLRRSSADAVFFAGVCARWLLYPENCAYPKLKLRAPDGQWQHYEVALNGQIWPAATPTQFEMAVDGKQGYADVDNLSLRDLDSGAELLSNGGFSATSNHWFFSSDRNHFPWHIKNFYVNSYFELGAVGAAALGLLLSASFASLAMRGLNGDSTATIALAAMAGFLLVGLFDSLFDVPRLTLVFFMVLYAASLRPQRAMAASPRRSRQRRRLHVEAAADT
ncbi:hypothetical protein E4L98_21205 [Duganella callida]|uniref:O-antigen ligase domain-containing protein n=1 Tax=Duganella callida TaxID=2561932 RepID=A0A4Y9S798_9BURK|nr:hypothetical protein E4L98_21205 [Duganella callida]